MHNAPALCLWEFTCNKTGYYLIRNVYNKKLAVLYNTVEASMSAKQYYLFVLY